MYQNGTTYSDGVQTPVKVNFGFEAGDLLMVELDPVEGKLIYSLPEKKKSYVLAINKLLLNE